MSKYVSGLEVYRDPLFQEFCRKYGVEWDLATKELTIVLTEDFMEVSQRYLAKKPEGLAETTNLHNQHVRTFQPRSNPQVSVEQVQEMKRLMEESKWDHMCPPGSGLERHVGQDGKSFIFDTVLQKVVG